MAFNGSLPKSEKLACKIAQLTASKERVDTQIPGLSLHRWTHPTPPTSYMMAPSICLVGQGRKRLFLGDEEFTFDADHFLITSVDLPVVTQVADATDDEPYLGLTLELDLKDIGQLMLDAQISTSREKPNSQSSVAVSRVPDSLLNAIERLLDLSDSPDDIPVLAPLIQKEINYRLLTCGQGPRLRQLVSMDSQGYRISRAIDWLKSNLDQPLRVEDLAGRVGLSSSAFHNHFRKITAMSPLQFQKKIRLNEARRLMLTEKIEATSAAFRVGYESPSQFNREYSRQFGAPPKRDITHILNEEI